MNQTKSSKIILGSAQFGLDYGINNSFGKLKEKEVFKILDFSRERGINIIDTANAYGSANNIIGNFIKKNPNSFKINTKFLFDQIPIDVKLNKTLSKLNICDINTCFFHNYSDFEEHGNKLRKFKDLGKIKKIGLSVYSNVEFEKACLTNWIDVIQFPYNILDNDCQRSKMIKLAKRKGKEIQARSIFLQGLFFMEIDKIPKNLFLLKPYIRKVHEIVLKKKVTLINICLGYVNHNKLIDNLIMGVDSFEQLVENTEISNLLLDKEVVELINNIRVIESMLLLPKNWY
tara:strand:- start:1405 stop:2268 length:864 start_codon:yes stop_codon:yes gene_type:complete